MWIEHYVDTAGVFVHVQNYCPGLAAVGSAENPAFRIRAEWMPQRCYENDIRIFRMNDQLPDRAAIAKPYIPPSLGAIERFVNPIALCRVAAYARFAGTSIDHVRVRRRDGNASYRRRFLVENRFPSRRAIRRFPDSAARRSEIIRGWIARKSGCRQRSSAPERTDGTVLHAMLLRFGLVLDRRLGRFLRLLAEPR